jgi:hypothetical protein
MNRLSLMLLMIASSLPLGCSRQEASATADSSAKYRLASEPSGVISVTELKTSTADEVAVVGRIGGESNPWVDGMAAFMLADEAVLDRCKVTCTDKVCTCHTKELNEATVLVKFVDKDGEPLPVDSRELLKVSELDRVIVKGRAQRDQEGNVVVVAGGIFVRR